jgi:hypothetical protein
MNHAEIKKLNEILPEPESRRECKLRVQFAFRGVLEPIIDSGWMSRVEDKYIEVAIAQLRLALAELDEGDPG